MPIPADIKPEDNIRDQITRDAIPCDHIIVDDWRAPQEV